jgi:hypothetical protein
VVVGVCDHSASAKLIIHHKHHHYFSRAFMKTSWNNLRSASSFPAHLDAVELIDARPAEAKERLWPRVRRGAARSAYMMAKV